MGFIISQAKYYNSICTFKLMYFSLVRFDLEYSSIIWNPLTLCYNNLIERVQKRFLLFFTGLLVTYNISYNEQLRIFQMKSLEKRHKLMNLCYLQKTQQMICSEKITVLLHFYTLNKYQLKVAVSLCHFSIHSLACPVNSKIKSLKSQYINSFFKLAI